MAAGTAKGRQSRWDRFVEAKNRRNNSTDNSSALSRGGNDTAKSSTIQVCEDFEAAIDSSVLGRSGSVATNSSVVSGCGNSPLANAISTQGRGGSDAANSRVASRRDCSAITNDSSAQTIDGANATNSSVVFVRGCTAVTNDSSTQGRGNSTIANDSSAQMRDGSDATNSSVVFVRGCTAITNGSSTQGHGSADAANCNVVTGGGVSTTANDNSAPGCAGSLDTNDSGAGPCTTHVERRRDVDDGGKHSKRTDHVSTVSSLMVDYKQENRQFTELNSRCPVQHEATVLEKCATEYLFTRMTKVPRQNTYGRSTFSPVIPSAKAEYFDKVEESVNLKILDNMSSKTQTVFNNRIKHMPDMPISNVKRLVEHIENKHINHIDESSKCQKQSVAIGLSSSVTSRLIQSNDERNVTQTRTYVNVVNDISMSDVGLNPTKSKTFLNIEDDITLSDVGKNATQSKTFSDVEIQDSESLNHYNPVPVCESSSATDISLTRHDSLDKSSVTSTNVFMDAAVEEITCRLKNLNIAKVNAVCKKGNNRRTHQHEVIKSETFGVIKCQRRKSRTMRTPCDQEMRRFSALLSFKKLLYIPKRETQPSSIDHRSAIIKTIKMLSKPNFQIEELSLQLIHNVFEKERARVVSTKRVRKHPKPNKPKRTRAAVAMLERKRQVTREVMRHFATGNVTMWNLYVRRLNRKCDRKPSQLAGAKV